MLKYFFICLLMMSVLVSCAGRVPTAKKAKSSISHYFSKYDKRFPGSPLSGKVSSVDIEAIDEIQKNMVSVAALVNFENSIRLPIRITFMRKEPLGWKPMGWENLISPSVYNNSQQ